MLWIMVSKCLITTLLCTFRARDTQSQMLCSKILYWITSIRYGREFVVELLMIPEFNDIIMHTNLEIATFGYRTLLNICTSAEGREQVCSYFVDKLCGVLSNTDYNLQIYILKLFYKLAIDEKGR
eukprot:335332_1